MADRPAYSEADIEILSAVEAVRRRPGLYVGETSPDAVHLLALELVDNAIREALRGHGAEVRVAIHADGSLSVADDGRGIPVGAGPDGLEPLMTSPRS